MGIICLFIDLYIAVSLYSMHLGILQTWTIVLCFFVGRGMGVVQIGRECLSNFHVLWLVRVHGRVVTS